MTSPLETEIRHLIQRAGPMPVSRYMTLCLTHPQYGYYVTRDPLGRGGDFTTAPEISQMFGELIGLWAVQVWKQMGAPNPVRLIELGPGRGTMMMDALRALRVAPHFLEAVRVHLVEINPALRTKQRSTLGKTKVPVEWHDTLADVPAGPSIILANEFFDALPIHQAIKHKGGWHARAVEIGAGDSLIYGVSPDPLPRFDLLLPKAVRDMGDGTIFEWREMGEVNAIARRLNADGGAALIVDYGHIRSDAGDTFQAIASHHYADPLKQPGEADLTAHVDFDALADAARDAGLRVHGPVEQGLFLLQLGIETRALSLMSKAEHEASQTIADALRRLISRERGGMGALFKVIGLSDPSLGELPAISDIVSAQANASEAAS